MGLVRVDAKIMQKSIQKENSYGTEIAALAFPKAQKLMVFKLFNYFFRGDYSFRDDSVGMEAMLDGKSNHE